MAGALRSGLLGMGKGMGVWRMPSPILIRSAIMPQMFLPHQRYATRTPKKSNDPSQPIVIAGSSISALATAIALGKVGYRKIEMLQTKPVEPIDARHVHLLHEPTMKVLDYLGVGKGLRNQGHSVTSELWSPSNNHKPYTQFSYGSPAFAISEGALKKALEQTAKPYVISRHGSGVEKVLSSDDHATCVLRGFPFSKKKSSVLIAADGAKSKVASLIAPKVKQTHLGMISWNAIVPRPENVEEDARHVYWANGSRLSWTPVNGNDIQVTYCKQSVAGTSTMRNGSRATMELVRDCESASIKTQWISPAAKEVLHSLFELTWYPCWAEIPVRAEMNGKDFMPLTCAVGAAAHPPTFQDGHSIALELEDAIILAESLRNTSSYQEGINQYFSNRKSRVQKWQKSETKEQKDLMKGRGPVTMMFASMRRSLFGLRGSMIKNDHLNFIKHAPSI